MSRPKERGTRFRHTLETLMFAAPSAASPAVLATGHRRPCMDAEEIYKEHLPIIGQIAQSVCRRHGVGDDDAEDFASDVRLKLCDNDYAVIRKFQNKCSFTTYLTVVINKTFLDHRRHLWGKWTPSAQAKRFGTVGMLLERLISRDG